MKPEFEMARRLAPILESGPSVVVCLSGGDKFRTALKELGVVSGFLDINFEHQQWMDSARLALTGKREEELLEENGLRFIKNPDKYSDLMRGLEEEEIPFLLALLVQEKGRKFLNKKNNFVIVKERVENGLSLQAMKKALQLNGIPEKKIITAAFTSSISPAVPPDVCSEKTFISSSPCKSPPGKWIHLPAQDQDLVLHAPLP